jgi:hypothetical protein
MARCGRIWIPHTKGQPAMGDHPANVLVVTNKDTVILQSTTNVLILKLRKKEAGISEIQ